MKKLKPLKWYSRELDGCVSSNGKPYSISFRIGTTNKLLVNFIGGGLSWNNETARAPMTISKAIRKKAAFYIKHVSPMMLKLAHVGILNTKDTRNPFHDWHALNIPYSTADLHIGNNDFEYANGNVLHHHGNKNVEKALGQLKDLFPDTPDVIAITGQSAGGFGCVAHSPKLKDIYPECEQFIIHSDGSHLHSHLWCDIVKNVWQVEPELAEHISSNDLIGDLFKYAQKNLPPQTLFLHSNSLWDEMLTKFMNKMNNGNMSMNSKALQQFNTTLLNVVKELKKELPNYYHFLTERGKKGNGATPHIFVGNPKLLYGKVQDSTSVADWLLSAIKGNPVDVGTQFLPTKAK